MSRLLESLTGLVLLDPWMLALVPVLAVCAWIARRRRAAIVFAPAALLAGPAGGALPATWRTRLAAAPAVLAGAGLVLLVVALARPVRRDRLPLETAGIDIVLCMDVSSSMLAEDLEARRSRLDIAKDAGVRFIAGRPHDRIGLVTFARFPDLRCPPTLDHDALSRILGAVETVDGDGPEDATGVGTAVARAAQVLRTSTAKSKVVILLTDGEENVATAAAPREIAPSHAGQLCETLGVKVYTIAAGAGAAGSGRPAPDTRPVERLSERTGGRFFAARDAAAVAAVYEGIDALEKVAFDEPRYRTEERFLGVLAAGLAFLLAAATLRATVLDVLP